MPNTREKEKLIELLKRTDREVYEALKDREDYREEMLWDYFASNLIANGVTVQKWIPVTERLPDGECLAVSMFKGPAYGEMLIGYVAEVSILDTGYACEGDGVILPNVTHWIPLPTPPKGE